MKTQITLVLILLCSFFSQAQQGVATIDNNAPDVEIKGTQVQKIFSEIMNQEYELHVNIPRFYEDTSRSFPVLFLLDSQWDFPLMQAIYGEQYYDGFVPELLIIGITWAGENVNIDKLRARDFTPTKAKFQYETGKAPEFLKFFRNELIPFIEKNYRVTGNRSLAGSSFGGLFTLFAMFTETDLFTNYILTSPALEWDERILFAVENEYSRNNSDLNARLYMAIGSYEFLDVFNELVNILNSRKYEGLKYEYKILDGIGHSGSKAEGYTRGIQFVFEIPEATVDEKILRSYEGEYSTADGVNIEIVFRESILFAVLPGEAEFPLYPKSETDFYVKGAYNRVHFQRDNSGRVNGMKVEQFSEQLSLKKL